MNTVQGQNNVFFVIVTLYQISNLRPSLKNLGQSRKFYLCTLIGLSLLKEKEWGFSAYFTQVNILDMARDVYKIKLMNFHEN